MFCLITCCFLLFSKSHQCTKEYYVISLVCGSDGIILLDKGGKYSNKSIDGISNMRKDEFNINK